MMKLCGGTGYKVTGPRETAGAVSQAMKDGKPAVIHAKVDPDAALNFLTDSLRPRA